MTSEKLLKALSLQIKMLSDTADDSTNGFPKELPRDSFFLSLHPKCTLTQKDQFPAIVVLVGLEVTYQNTQLMK